MFFLRMSVLGTDLSERHVEISWKAKKINPKFSPEHIHLGEECVIGDAAEEVPLAHVLGDDSVDKLLEEHLESILLGTSVTQTPLLGAHIQLSLSGCQELLVIYSHDGDLRQRKSEISVKLDLED